MGFLLREYVIAFLEKQDVEKLIFCEPFLIFLFDTYFDTSLSKKRTICCTCCAFVTSRYTCYGSTNVKKKK